MSAPKSDKAGVKKAYRALVKAGYSVDVIDGAGDEFSGLDEAGAISEVMSCDDGYFVAYDGAARIGFVWFVFGNEPYEVISDYSLSLSHVIDPLTEGWY